MAKLYICETFKDIYEEQEPYQHPGGGFVHKLPKLVKSAPEQLREYLQSFEGELNLETAFERKDGTLVAILWTEEANEV